MGKIAMNINQLGAMVIGGAMLISSAQAALVHQYQFNGDLSDDLAGQDLVAGGGTVTAGQYNFDAGEGLSLSNPNLADAGNYSLELLFTFANVDGFRKIIDFKNRVSDNGLYALSGNLVFFGGASGAGTPLAANVESRVVITRDSGTESLLGYVNGVEEFSFIDTGDLGIFNAVNNIANFFYDDSAVSGEVSAGAVDLIRIYDNVLTNAEVAALVNPLPPVSPVPAPATLWMLAFALAPITRSLRSRKNQ